MSVTLNEDLISLSQAARELPGRPHLSTIWRWTTRGVRGVVLETLVVAGRRFTSHEALQRFVAATTAAATRAAPAVSVSGRRIQDIEQAEREFDGRQ